MPERAKESKKQILNPYIREMIRTPAGKLALQAVSGTMSIESPYFTGDMRHLHQDVLRPMTISASVGLEEATKDMTPEARRAFFEEFIAAIITLFKYDMHEKYFEEIFKKNEAELRKYRGK